MGFQSIAVIAGQPLHYVGRGGCSRLLLRTAVALRIAIAVHEDSEAQADPCVTLAAFALSVAPILEFVREGDVCGGLVAVGEVPRRIFLVQLPPPPPCPACRPRTPRLRSGLARRCPPCTR